jgi:hypothetical protein
MAAAKLKLNIKAIVLISALVGIIGTSSFSPSVVSATPRAPAFVPMKTSVSTGGQGKSSPVKHGTWGGQSIAFTVQQNAVSIEFDCAQGEIPRQLKADKKGHFRVEGTLTTRTPGPVRRDNIPQPQPAIYEGTVKGDVMSLKITLVKTNESAGEFKVQRGKEPVLFRCA